MESSTSHVNLPQAPPAIMPNYQRPEFTTILHDTTVQEGEKFTFECHVSGYPTPTVIWQKEGITIANNPDYFTMYRNGVCTLMIEETFSEDSARFSCKATNELGTAETEAVLKVRGKDDLKTPISSQKLILSNTFKPFLNIYVKDLTKFVSKFPS